MDLFKKRYGQRFDKEERDRKKEARKVHEVSKASQKLTGIKGKLHAKERYKEKAKMRKAIKAHEEKDAKVETPKQA
jgi:ribosome biogenesis protein NSA2